MREAASQLHEGKPTAPKSKSCPKCGKVSMLFNPGGHITPEAGVYGCPGCGNVFKHDAAPFVKQGAPLTDEFHGATMSNEVLKDELVTGPARAVLQARVMEYGVQMWFDGLKQGLLLGAVSQVKEEKKT